MLRVANRIRDRVVVPRHDVALGWTDEVDVIVRVRVTGRFVYRSFETGVDDADLVDAVVAWIGDESSNRPP
jgi:hypothetical protein